MNKNKQSVMSLAAVIVVAALAGCSPVASSPTPSSSGEPSSAPSPTPTAAPTTPAAPDPTDSTTWIISDAGVGPIEIGGDFAATLGVLPTDWTNDTANCAWTAWWNATDSSYGVFFVRGTESDTAPISEISVYTAAETVAAVPSPVTADGLGIGSTRDEVIAAYPEAQQGTAQIGSGTWLMLPGSGEARVFFEFREGSDAASDVVVTTRSEPSYEVCG